MIAVLLAYTEGCPTLQARSGALCGPPQQAPRAGRGTRSAGWWRTTWTWPPFLTSSFHVELWWTVSIQEILWWRQIFGSWDTSTTSAASRSGETLESDGGETFAVRWEDGQENVFCYSSYTSNRIGRWRIATKYYSNEEERQNLQRVYKFYCSCVLMFQILPGDSHCIVLKISYNTLSAYQLLQVINQNSLSNDQTVWDAVDQ